MEMVPCECGCGETIPALDAKGRPKRYVFGHWTRKVKCVEVRMIACACGCGEMRPVVDAKGRVGKYINGHQNRHLTPAQLAARRNNLRKAHALGPWNAGTRYIVAKRRDGYANKGAWHKAINKVLGTKCMRCGWDEAPCDAHHIMPKSRGGRYTIENGIVLCPNCHRLVHHGKVSIEELQRIRAEAQPQVEMTGFHSAVRAKRKARNVLSIA